MAAYPNPCAAAARPLSAAISKPAAAHTDLLAQQIAVDFCMIFVLLGGILHGGNLRVESLPTRSQSHASRVKHEVAPA
jgi:hypothetical protein